MNQIGANPAWREREAMHRSIPEIANWSSRRYGGLMRIALVFIAIVLLSRAVLAQKAVSFATKDEGLVHADEYGKGDRAVVLAHGARFNKASWKKQALALEKEGFRVLAIDFRGYGKSTGPGQSEPFTAPLYQDVLAAVRYLRNSGRRACRWSAEAWAEARRVTRPWKPSPTRSIAWCFSGLLEATKTRKR